MVGLSERLRRCKSLEFGETHTGTILRGPSSPGIGSCREKPFGLYGNVEIVSGEYGNPVSTLYPVVS
jgi:hypothetical protein